MKCMGVVTACLYVRLESIREIAKSSAAASSNN
jgi:hypothetical protein